ncbi:hypothetical protein AvCA_01040 [Azotobacter vinelandii CA]|uniref:Uncharacterized protein n=2 Tax=Azotobacter vinelandii TaxID=354 RepID=C1DG44_AZOVD|nr:hypothetical protein [Azotobacter vinelandii]ACO76371.1 conserved hypothetical protein [Azotobacter vinelandii DJ]AGK15696.1 hypothetical protein AvCA_01040 [Azotobacter vinelandii CA]AGK19078.1 hypothetical protein AvCA6_01040 [Azotobacter vinelandii CA6]WKN22152.1 hypothetical protein AVAEIV_000100 [Azotobacter vinelandii]SFX76023.1 hypothetical protein SAMN04244547_02658 [Azotobacter vinelandii]
MNIPALRQLIECARQHESRHGTLARQLESRMQYLHPAICLPEEDALGVLTKFVDGYLEQVPELLEAAHAVACGAGIEAQVEPVLKVAAHFFLSPPQVLEGQEGLAGLLDEAYLAHRLVEEVNDRYIACIGQPLIPLDTTVANLIAHRLIGEEFANRLDEAVHLAVNGLLGDTLFEQASLDSHRARLSNPKTVAAWLAWPCLSRQFGVELQLSRAAG